jgi:Secretin and TonB N terminus short domain
VRSQSLQVTACAVAISIGVLGSAPHRSRAADPVEATQQVSFDIKAQSLASALDAFALQTHQKILFAPEIVDGKTTQGVKGKFTSDAALSKLLAGTGLIFSRSAAGMILVSTPSLPNR